MKRRAVVSGAGIVTAAGAGMAAFGAALDAGKSLSKPIEALDAGTFPVSIACEAPGVDARKLAKNPKDAKVVARASALALAALKDLVESTPAPWVTDPWSAGFFLGVGLEQGDHRDVLQPLAVSARGNRIVLGRLASAGMEAMNPLSSLKTLPNMALAHVAMKLGDAAPRGPNAAYSPFDAASLEAMAAAGEAVLAGECDLCLAGGADAPVSLFGLTMFSRLKRAGLGVPLGEAAALFLVEEAEGAQKAGRKILAEIEGFGSAGDGAAVGEPSMVAASRAIGAAVAFAGKASSDVDVLVTSGASASTSGAEIAAVEQALGARPKTLVAPRVVFGQTVAAAGAVGVAAALHELSSGSARRALVSATAFGGSYAALLLKRWKA